MALMREDGDKWRKVKGSQLSGHDKEDLFSPPLFVQGVYVEDFSKRLYMKNEFW